MGVPALAPSGALRVDDHHRALGVHHAVQRHRTQYHAGPPAATAAADHKEGRTRTPLGEHGTRRTVRGHHGHPAPGWHLGHLVLCSGQRPLPDVCERDDHVNLARVDRRLYRDHRLDLRAQFVGEDNRARQRGLGGIGVVESDKHPGPGGARARG